jgi:hypothetical protein
MKARWIPNTNQGKDSLFGEMLEAVSKLIKKTKPEKRLH